MLASHLHRYGMETFIGQRSSGIIVQARKVTWFSVIRTAARWSPRPPLRPGRSPCDLHEAVDVDVAFGAPGRAVGRFVAKRGRNILTSSTVFVQSPCQQGPPGRRHINARKILRHRLCSAVNANIDRGLPAFPLETRGQRKLPWG
jgi:hypothetical protein